MTEDDDDIDPAPDPETLDREEPPVDLGEATPAGDLDLEVARGQEKHRERMAMWLIWIFAGVVLLSFGTVWVQGTVSEGLSELLKVIVPVLTTLLGSIIGFYYGSKSNG